MSRRPRSATSAIAATDSLRTLQLLAAQAALAYEPVAVVQARSASCHRQRTVQVRDAEVFARTDVATGTQVQPRTGANNDIEVRVARMVHKARDPVERRAAARERSVRGGSASGAAATPHVTGPIPAAAASCISTSICRACAGRQWAGLR